MPELRRVILMICTIQQPNYIPWLGLFDKIAHSDVFIIYDNTQYTPDSVINRNKILAKQGWVWLTVPVKHNFGAKISEIEIDNSKNWRRKHWNSLLANYSNAPHFKEYKEHFEKIYSREWTRIADLNTELLRLIIKLLGIKVRLLVASEICDLKSKSTDALIELCKAAKCDEYISGRDGRVYLEVEKFKQQGIKLVFQDYKHPEYSQAFPGFEPYMSVVDLLFNHGPDSLKILKNDQ